MKICMEAFSTLWQCVVKHWNSFLYKIWKKLFLLQNSTIIATNGKLQNKPYVI